MRYDARSPAYRRRRRAALALTAATACAIAALILTAWPVIRGGLL